MKKGDRFKFRNNIYIADFFYSRFGIPYDSSKDCKDTDKKQKVFVRSIEGKRFNLKDCKLVKQ